MDCETSNRSVVFSVGNGSNRIQIEYVDGSTSLPGIYDVPVQLMPDFDYNSETTPDMITAIPVGDRVSVSEACTQTRITHPSGEVCYGRQFWDNTYRQELLLTGKDSRPLWESPLGAHRVADMNADGYIFAEFSCRAYGATTAGGCYITGDDDLVETVSCE